MIRKILPLFLILLLVIPSIVKSGPAPVAPAAPLDLPKVLTYLKDLIVWGLQDQLKITVPAGVSLLQALLMAGLYFVLPVVGVFLIVYGFLDVLKIFERGWINTGLSIVICLVFISSGLYARLTYTLFRISGIFAVFTFALMFIGGIWLYRKRRFAEWETLASIEGTFDNITTDLGRDLANRRKEYEELARRLARERNWLRRRDINNRMKQIRKDIDSIVSRLKEIREEKEI